MPSQSGIDCSKYAMSNRLALELNFDSTQNGFKLHEADSTYIITFNSLGFKQPSDTIWLDRFAFIQQNGKASMSLEEFLILAQQIICIPPAISLKTGTVMIS